MQLSGSYEPALVDAQLTLLVMPWDRDPIGDELFCADFSNAGSVEFTDDGFWFKGLHFVDLGTDGLQLVESVRPDDVPELRFSNDGVRIELPFPVHAVRVDVVAGTGAAIVATADRRRWRGRRHRSLPGAAAAHAHARRPLADQRGDAHRRRR